MATPKRRAGAILPPAEWRAMHPVEKMIHLLGRSLDDAYTIAHWNPNEADVHQLSAKIRVIEIMTKHGFRFAIEAMRDRSQERAIETLAAAITNRDTREEPSPHAEVATIATPVCAEAEQAPAPKPKRKRNQ